MDYHYSIRLYRRIRQLTYARIRQRTHLRHRGLLFHLKAVRRVLLLNQTNIQWNWTVKLTWIHGEDIRIVAGTAWTTSAGATIATTRSTAGWVAHWVTWTWVAVRQTRIKNSWIWLNRLRFHVSCCNWYNSCWRISSWCSRWWRVGRWLISCCLIFAQDKHQLDSRSLLIKFIIKQFIIMWNPILLLSLQKLSP